MARRTYVQGKWRDILGDKPNLYYVEKGKKVPFEISNATKSFMKKFNAGNFKK